MISGSQTIAVTYCKTDDATLASLGEYGANKVIVNKSLTVADTSQITKLMMTFAYKLDWIFFKCVFSEAKTFKRHVTIPSFIGFVFKRKNKKSLEL